MLASYSHCCLEQKDSSYFYRVKKMRQNFIGKCQLQFYFSSSPRRRVRKFLARRVLVAASLTEERAIVSGKLETWSHACISHVFCGHSQDTTYMDDPRSHLSVMPLAACSKTCHRQYIYSGPPPSPSNERLPQRESALF